MQLSRGHDCVPTFAWHVSTSHPTAGMQPVVRSPPRALRTAETHPVFIHAGWLGCPLPVPSLRPLLGLPPLQPKFQLGHHPLQGASLTSCLGGPGTLHTQHSPACFTRSYSKGVRAAAPLLLLTPGPRLRVLGKHQQAMLGAVRTLWFSKPHHPPRERSETWRAHTG